MSQNAIKYLLEHKDKFTKEKLVGSLRRAGYQNDQIVAALNEVFPVTEKKPAAPVAPPTAKDFIDIRKSIVYSTRKIKIIDFIIGLLLPWVIGTILNIVLFGLGCFITLVIYIVLISLTKDRRHYVYRGLIVNLYIILILILIVMVIFFLITSF